MPITAIAYAIQGIQLIEQLIAAGLEASANIAALKAKLQQFQAEGRDPTDAEWSAQDAEIKAKLATLNS